MMACCSGLRREYGVMMTCTWLFSAAGYYRYDEGFTPHFEGVEQYTGQLIHPQKWPENLDYSGKRVLVIGSGATAVADGLASAAHAAASTPAVV